MKRFIDLKSLKEALSKMEPGDCVLVNVSTLMKAFSENLFPNHEDNRNASDSSWNKGNYQNYATNIFDEAENYQSRINLDDYMGHMSPINFVLEDGKFKLKDGGHRQVFFTEILDFDIPTKFKDKLNENSFLNQIISEQKTGSYSTETKKVFDNCFIPIIRFKDSPNLYIGGNSSKPMKSQQKNRVLYSKNHLFKDLSKFIKTSSFSLCAVNSSKEETSTVDTIAFLGYLGSDFKASKVNTATYILDKYTDKESQDKLIEFGKKLIDTMQMYYLDEFSFAFNGWQFKNAYMYGLLKLVKEYSIAKKCKEYNINATKLRKEILSNNDMFFETLETSLNLLNNKKFLKNLNSSSVKKSIKSIYVDSNGTGSFSRGDAIYNALTLNVNNPLI